VGGIIITSRHRRPLLEPLEDRTAPAADWLFQGPGPILNGQVEHVAPNDEVVGAIHAVAAHPANADILYVGAVNGGIWKTANATAVSPTWVPLTDQQESLSISAVQFDPTDPTHNTLVAGVGRYSAFGQQGGARTGLLRTTDGGTSWTAVGETFLRGRNISGVAARGGTIVVSVNTAEHFTLAATGVFRSTDGGATFTQLSSGNGTGTSGLPEGVSYDLVGDPLNRNVLYTNVVFAENAGGRSGIYKSTDTGATWARVSSPAIEALITANTSNLEMAVGNSNNVYLGIIQNGNPVGFFRSGDGGTTWVQMDTPQTNENGINVGLNPRGVKGPGPDSAPEAIAGGQGHIHFSILADPGNPSIVYVGGDRQPTADGDAGGFPNSIGATDFSGRLFRGDASQPQGSQWVHLTHSATLGATGGGTAGSSAPHADSRDMVFDALGRIIEVDDGGVYRRTSPRDNTGDWFSINGNLGVTEVRDVAYDTVSKVIISGNQDTGTTAQTAPGSTTWDSVSTADGGDVAVDTTTLAAQDRSVRYSSNQNLRSFRRQIVNADNVVVESVQPALAVTRGEALQALFITPLALNAVDPTRLIIVGANGVYESLDQGDTVAQLDDGALAGGYTENAVAYGGRRGGVANADVLYVANGDRVLVRTAAGAALTLAAPLPGSGNETIRDIVIDPDDWMTAHVTDADQVFRTTDAGASWTDVTGDLITGGASELRTLEFITGPADDVILVGNRAGVFKANAGRPGAWSEVGTSSLPNAPVWDLDYDPTDNVLIAGTLGRGAWLLRDARDLAEQDDFILVRRGAGNFLEVVRNGVVVDWVDLTSAAFLVVEGGGGNDGIEVAADVALPVSIVGGAGDDTIVGGAGNDTILGGTGNDLVLGRSGDDQLFGQGGNDSIDGGAGNDSLAGGTGNDLMFGSAGNDLMFGEAGNDAMDGGDGDDGMDGGGGNDLMFGLDGNDLIFGLDGNDSIDGGAGDDSIDAGTSDDLVFGSSGNDQIFAGGGNDSVDGNDGHDAIDGGDGNDQLFGSGGDDLLFGGPGADSVNGGAGFNLIIP
jgi:Ca2+-binding RTX toxin-like protein